MKAVVCSRYGSPDVLELKDVPDPTPKDREILIRIHATTVTTGDWRVRSLQVPPGLGLVARLGLGLVRPRQPILGSELAGEVVAIGERVTRFAVGDRVFAFADARMGCHAEYRCMPEDGAVVKKPANLSYAQAAALSFGGTTALGFLRRANVQRGERVLVISASGGVGTAAVQLAKHFGAEVTGVCSTANVELVRSLGADRVIDYTRHDFTKDGETYDVILDTTGTVHYARAKASLRPRGRLGLVAAGLPDMLQAPWVALTSDKRIVAGPVVGSAEALQLLARLAEAGELTPVIDRVYPLDRIADAHHHVDAGHKRGNVVITVVPEAPKDERNDEARAPMPEGGPQTGGGYRARTGDFRLAKPALSQLS